MLDLDLAGMFPILSLRFSEARESKKSANRFMITKERLYAS